MEIELSYCVVNTNQRQLLHYCLDAIARERATVPFETETLVLDNGSVDGSSGAAREHPVTTEVVARRTPRGRGENDRTLLERARGRFCLLLDEDSELEPGATAALHDALAADERAGAAGATLVRPDGEREPSAFRFPRAWAGVVPARVRERLVDQSRGDAVRRVDWAPSCALLVRRAAAAAVGWDAAGEVASCRRLRAGGWKVLYVPHARAVHHPEPAS